MIETFIFNPQNWFGILTERLPLQAIMPLQGTTAQIGLFIYLLQAAQGKYNGQGAQGNDGD